MKLWRVCLAVASLTIGVAAAVVQQDVEIKVTPVAGSVHMLEGRGGNIGITAGADGKLIVDTQFAPLAGQIREAVSRLGAGPLKFVLNTHWHGDHTGGNVEFGAESTINAHENVRSRHKTGGRGGLPEGSPGLPVITFADSLSLHFNGEEIRVYHLPPGHTDGDSVVHFTKSNVVHMGDHFFSGRFPFIDLDSGGDVAGYIRNVENVLEKLPDGAKVIPGHGPLSTESELRTFLGMLKETTGQIRAAIDAGKSVEAIKAAGLPDKWESWGTGFINTERWIDIVYKSFTR